MVDANLPLISKQGTPSQMNEESIHHYHRLILGCQWLGGQVRIHLPQSFHHHLLNHGHKQEQGPGQSRMYYTIFWSITSSHQHLAFSAFPTVSRSFVPSTWLLCSHKPHLHAARGNHYHLSRWGSAKCPVGRKPTKLTIKIKCNPHARNDFFFNVIFNSLITWYCSHHTTWVSNVDSYQSGLSERVGTTTLMVKHRLNFPSIVLLQLPRLCCSTDVQLLQFLSLYCLGVDKIHLKNECMEWSKATVWVKSSQSQATNGGFGMAWLLGKSRPSESKPQLWPKAGPAHH